MTGSSRRPGATIDTPTNLTAAQHLQQWVESGYFNKDTNATEYTDANARFGKGEGVFMFNGDWQNAVYDKDLAGNVGFFVFPPAEAGGSLGAMSAPLTYGIADKAKNADCAAAFFNWVATNETARQIDVTIGGSNPGGPTDLTVPPAATGSVTNETLAAGANVAKDNGAMDFIANATGSIFAQGWTPELQKLVGGKQDAAGLLKAVQARVREGACPLSHAVDEARPRQGVPQPPARPLVGGSSRRIPWTLGIRRQTLVGWLFVLPALAMYGLFVLQPLALTVQYSFYRWDGVGPATWVGLANYAAVLSEPKLVETLFNAFRLVLFYSLIPVTLGLVTASVIHRIANGRLGTISRTVLFLPQVIPLVAAGIIWGRLLSLNGLVNQTLTAIGLGDVAHGLARRFRRRAPCGRFDRSLGPARILHGPAPDRHGPHRCRPVRVGPDRWCGLAPGVLVDHGPEPPL